MKRIALPLLILALAVLACNITPTPTGEPPVTEPPVTEPPVTEPPVTTNVTCNELSLYLDPALASSYDCQTVPESPYEMEMYPAHTELTLQGYPLADKFFDPHISVYPVAAYTSLMPDLIPGRVTELQFYIGLGSISPFEHAFTVALPFLPQFNAAQAFYAQAIVLPFVSGSGIRFLAEYAQYYVPVNNHELFYTYQALTGDGQYWVSVILPVNLGILPANADNPPGGVTWEEFSNNYETYINDMVSQLNSQAPDAYLPTLGMLDALAASITITP